MHRTPYARGARSHCQRSSEVGSRGGTATTERGAVPVHHFSWHEPSRAFANTPGSGGTNNVIDRARDMAREAADQVQEAAGRVADGAMKLTEKPQP
jgi:hypothetical protein